MLKWSFPLLVQKFFSLLLLRLSPSGWVSSLEGLIPSGILFEFAVFRGDFCSKLVACNRGLIGWLIALPGFGGRVWVDWDWPWHVGEAGRPVRVVTSVGRGWVSVVRVVAQAVRRVSQGVRVVLALWRTPWLKERNSTSSCLEKSRNIFLKFLF